MLSKQCVQKMSHGQLIHHYLLSSFSYYILHSSPMQDEAFDWLCKELLDNYDNIDHTHKHYVDKEALKAGTAYHMKESDYPLIVQHGAEHYIRKCESGEMEKILEEDYEPLKTE